MNGQTIKEGTTSQFSFDECRFLNGLGRAKMGDRPVFSLEHNFCRGQLNAGCVALGPNKPTNRFAASVDAHATSAALLVPGG